MTANAIFGVIGTLLGMVACFLLGYYCALQWVIAALESIVRDETANEQQNQKGKK